MMRTTLPNRATMLEQSRSGITTAVVMDACSRPSVAPYCERVRALVSTERFAHIRRVARLASLIARAHAFSEAELRATQLAAVLHDVAREFPASRMFRLAPPEFEIEKQYPLTLHGRASRRVAELWGVTDKVVLDAIEGHVFGVDPGDRVGMALYVADISEPGRGVNAHIRKLAMTDLPAAYRLAVRAKVEYLQAIGKPIHPLTLGVYAALANDD